MKKLFGRIVIFALTAVILTAMLGSCSKPKYEDVEERLKYLIEQSYEVNEIIFGKGLETYERVYEPKMQMFRGEKNYYYYEIEDEELGKIVAYRGTLDYKADYAYLRVTEDKIDGEDEIYRDSEGQYYYPIEYTEKKYDFYYDESSPADYDYVKIDGEIKRIDDIKAIAENVYSKSYLEDVVYEMLFVGAVSPEGTGLDGLTARYIEIDDLELGSVLMKSNVYKSVSTEKRIFVYESAEIVKPSNKNTVNVKMDSYLESAPDDITSVRITLVMQDGEWYLDSPTY